LSSGFPGLVTSNVATVRIADSDLVRSGRVDDVHRDPRNDGAGSRRWSQARTTRPARRDLTRPMRSEPLKVMEVFAAAYEDGRGIERSDGAPMAANATDKRPPYTPSAYREPQWCLRAHALTPANCCRVCRDADRIEADIIYKRARSGRLCYGKGA
jgi:hypothetical protein